MENGMVLEQGNKRKRVYAFCDHCRDEIYEDEEITLISESDVAIICHSDCFDTFINNNKETFVAKERM